MSLSGNLAMGLLRWIRPGKGSFSDLEKLRERARRENEGFVLRMPKHRRAECILLPDKDLPCMVVRPRRLADPDKAILYLYGGVTNHWNTQRNMAVRYPPLSLRWKNPLISSMISRSPSRPSGRKVNTGQAWGMPSLILIS